MFGYDIVTIEQMNLAIDTFNVNKENKIFGVRSEGNCVCQKKLPLGEISHEEDNDEAENSTTGFLESSKLTPIPLELHVVNIVSNQYNKC